jgi:hypothetical protein
MRLAFVSSSRASSLMPRPSKFHLRQMPLLVPDEIRELLGDGHPSELRVGPGPLPGVGIEGAEPGDRCLTRLGEVFQHPGDRRWCSLLVGADIVRID